MENKTEELKVSLKLLNRKLHFEGMVSGQEPISIDYTPPLGDNLGYTSLELLLLSLSSCVASTVLSLLRKMNKTINGLDITATGIRNEEHPTGFKTINLKLNFKSPDVTDNDIDKVVKLAEELYCPVWAMLEGNTDIKLNYNTFND